MSTSKALFGFAYTEKSLSFLESLQAKLRRQVIGKIQALADNPLPPGHKMIRGSAGDEERMYRIRSGDYRVLYLVRSNPSHVVILDIDHRKDIYK